MKKAIKAYLFKKSDMAYTKKEYLRNADKDDFEEITVIISSDEIEQWNHELEVLEDESS